MLKISDLNWLLAQVTKDGVVHLAFHPRDDAIILAAGSKGGGLGLWHLDFESFQVASRILYAQSGGCISSGLPVQDVIHGGRTFLSKWQILAAVPGARAEARGSSVCWQARPLRWGFCRRAAQRRQCKPKCRHARSRWCSGSCQRQQAAGGRKGQRL